MRRLAPLSESSASDGAGGRKVHLHVVGLKLTLVLFTQKQTHSIAPPRARSEYGYSYYFDMDSNVYKVNDRGMGV